jgi:NAD(P)-dependent dehydrogenase (short-subunit alcohol dehydrogenase family)
MKDLESTTEADFDATYNLNVKGPYFLVQVSVLVECFDKSIADRWTCRKQHLTSKTART